MNDQNLRPVRNKSEARERGKKGGIASGKARAEKRDLRKALELLLEREYTDKNGNKLSGTEAITAKLFEQAKKGNIRAFETLRDTIGQKPVERVVIAEVDQDIIDEVERAVLEE